MKVSPGDSNYDAMYQVYKREKGTTFSFNGQTWMAVEDNAQVFFVLRQDVTGIDSSYGSSSIPR